MQMAPAEMEEDYEHETGSGFRGNKGSTEQ